MLQYYLDGFIFTPSKNKKKKYDVYDKNNYNYITSFGSREHEQYYDKIGFYSHLNHNDKKRRVNYHKRFQTGLDVKPNSALYFATKYLW